MRKASRSMIFIRHLKTKTMKDLKSAKVYMQCRDRNYQSKTLYVRRGWGFPGLERKLKGMRSKFFLGVDDRLPSFDVDCFQRCKG